MFFLLPLSCYVFFPSFNRIHIAPLHDVCAHAFLCEIVFFSYSLPLHQILMMNSESPCIYIYFNLELILNVLFHTNLNYLSFWMSVYLLISYFRKVEHFNLHMYIDDAKFYKIFRYFLGSNKNTVFSENYCHCIWGLSGIYYGYQGCHPSEIHSD